MGLIFVTRMAINAVPAASISNRIGTAVNVWPRNVHDPEPIQETIPVPIRVPKPVLRLVPKP